MNLRNSLVVNHLKGIGTNDDPASHAYFKTTPFNHNSFSRNFYVYENLYQLNELAKNGIDFKAKGPVSKWRNWQIEDDEKKKELENLEKDLKLKEKLEEALRAMYLYGGSLIFMISDQDSLEPFNPDTKIESLNVIPASWIISVEIENDINSTHFSEAKYFQLINGEKIHASHCMQFKMQTIKPFWQTSILSPNLYFGYSLLMPLETQLLQYELNNNTLINMAQDSQRIVVQTKNLEEKISKAGGRGPLAEKYKSLNAKASDISMTVLGDGDNISVLEKNYQQILEAQKDVALRILGAMRVPEVIGLGKSLTGWSNDTEGMERIYHEPMVEEQNIKLSPALRVLDNILLREVGLSENTEFVWNPLSDPNQKELEEIKLLKIDGLLKLNELGILDQDEILDEVNLLDVTQSEIKKREDSIFLDDAISDVKNSLLTFPKEKEEKALSLFEKIKSFFSKREV